MFMNYRKILAAIVLTVLICNSMPFSVYASDSTIKPHFLKWSNAAAISVDSNSEDDETRITMNTMGLKKGYYSTYVFENKKRDWSEYGELAFSISNETEAPLKFNMIVTLENGVRLTVSDKSAVMIQHKNSDKMNLTYPTWGSIELEGHFQGTVHVPFSSLQVQNATEPLLGQESAAITSWGIIANTTEDAKQEFYVDDFQLVLKENSRIQNELAGAVLKGDQQVLKPYIGDSIAQYSLETKDLNLPVSFKLEAPIDGVTITRDGRLTLRPDIHVDTLPLYVDIDNKWRRSFTVNLIPSWFLNAKQQDGTSLTIPTTDEMSKVTIVSDPFINKKMLIFVRIIIIVIGATMGMLYWGWRKKLRLK